MKKIKASRVILFVILCMTAVVMMVPFAWLVLSSFRENMDILSNPFGTPKSLSIENYTSVLTRQPMLKYLFNTFAAALLAVVIDVIIAIMTGYAMMHRFRFKKALSTAFYVGLFIPATAFMVPYYIFISKLHMYDTLYGLGLIYAAINLPFSIMMMGNFLRTIPMQILESGRIDGATTNQILLHLVFPMSKPGVVTVSIFVIINTWNELFFANLLTQSDRAKTITVSIKSYLSAFEANYGYAFAAMIISILPTIIVYIFLTDKIIGGMTAGAVKE